MTPSVAARPRAVLLSGEGHFGDRWHDYAATSDRVTALLQAEGLQVDRTADVLAGVCELDASADLLVVNVGEGARPDPGHTERAIAHGLRTHLDAGRAVLALHSSAAAFAGVEEWESAIGARWVAGRSWHPPLGRGRVRVHHDRHRVVAGRTGFDVTDELYCDLRRAADLVPLADHVHEDRSEPLLWARTTGPARIVYDALGHDPRSFEATEHAMILGQAIGWLIAPGRADRAG